MSAIDLILSNQMIVISFGFVLLPLFLAVLYIIVTRVRAIFASKRGGNQAIDQEADIGFDTPFEEDLESEEFIEEEEEVIEPVPLPVAKKPVTIEAPKPEAGQESESNAFQSIISSVFEDEDVLEKAALLLGDAEKIDIHDLAQTSEEIAVQIRQRMGQVAPGGK
jgi:hypothetical protein